MPALGGQRGRRPAVTPTPNAAGNSDSAASSRQPVPVGVRINCGGGRWLGRERCLIVSGFGARDQRRRRYRSQAQNSRWPTISANGSCACAAAAMARSVLDRRGGAVAQQARRRGTPARGPPAGMLPTLVIRPLAAASRPGSVPAGWWARLGRLGGSRLACAREAPFQRLRVRRQPRVRVPSDRDRCHHYCSTVRIARAESHADQHPGCRTAATCPAGWAGSASGSYLLA